MDLDFLGLDGQEPQTLEDWRAWNERRKAAQAARMAEADQDVTAEEKRHVAMAKGIEAALRAEDAGAGVATVRGMIVDTLDKYDGPGAQRPVRVTRAKLPAKRARRHVTVEEMYGELERIEQRDLALPSYLVGNGPRLTLMREVKE